MRNAQHHDPDLRHEHLQVLSRKLTPRGFHVELGASQTGMPLLIVTNPAQPGLLSENIACIADSDGTLHYRWPWGHLAEATDLVGAVADVIRVLGGDHG